jgi:hypothetical protein
MVNMKSTEKPDDERTELEKPEYPYGLCIELDEESLGKLGVTELPKVGATMTITAKVFVKTTSAYTNMDEGEEKRVQLQITDMEIAAPTKSKSAANALYGE